MNGEPSPLYVDTAIDGMLFDNVVLGGKLISNKDALLSLG